MRLLNPYVLFLLSLVHLDLSGVFTDIIINRFEAAPERERVPPRLGKGFKRNHSPARYNYSLSSYDQEVSMHVFNNTLQLRNV
jgi:hypothetical protein